MLCVRRWPRLFVIAALAAPAAALEIKRSVLSDGAVLLVSEQHQLPMVTMTIAFDAGARRDPEGKAGLASLTAASLTLGTKDLSAAQFNQKVDFMGSSIAVGAGARLCAGELHLAHEIRRTRPCA